MSRHLMARFRRSAADGDGLHLDWRELDTNGNWVAQLENGDHIYSFGVGPDADQWGYVLYGPKTRHDGNPNETDQSRSYQRFTRDDGGVYSEVLGGGSGHPDPRSAMRAAEGHYFGLGRRGQAPAARDYAEYDHLDRRDDLDDDFGDIFGGDR